MCLQYTRISHFNENTDTLLVHTIIQSVSSSIMDKIIKTATDRNGGQRDVRPPGTVAGAGAGSNNKVLIFLDFHTQFTHALHDVCPSCLITFLTDFAI